MENQRDTARGIGAGILSLGVIVAALLLPPRPPAPEGGHASTSGLDSGLDAISLAKLGISGEVRGGWMRLRGVDLAKVPETREALGRLRLAGWRTCVLLRLSVKDWKTKYLPDDLRETYENGRRLGAAFGDLMGAWEVDNEPDLGFVPELAERYTAFLKATYLGLKAGIAEAEEQRAKSRAQRDECRALSSMPPTGESLVLMGSLGLPPGPWLERFAANDGFAYTDGYNYHYYGYADDFTSVYRQHEAAATALSEKSLGPIAGSVRSAPRSVQKHLPVFLTEIGFGMLGKVAGDTKEGRLRQWRWFKSVGEQIATLKTEGPMAFYLPPYLEYGLYEYGLTVPAMPAAVSRGQRTQVEEQGAANDGLKTEWRAGGITYTPKDFGAKSPEFWMQRIGEDLDGNEITPALAWWMGAPREEAPAVGREQRARGGMRQARGLSQDAMPFAAGSMPSSSASRRWPVTAPAPSPVVLDFLAGDGLQAIKRYNAMFVTRRSPEVAEPEKGEPRPKPPIPARSEEFMIQVRTQNGNLFEVYPKRVATLDWQHYLEPHDNFTLSFYGRAELPWRLMDNKPVSLVFVMYPKSLPTVHEFRRPLLLRLGTAQGVMREAGNVGDRPPSTGVVRYGRGEVILYNFSSQPITGKLVLPASVTTYTANFTKSISLAAGERKIVEIGVVVPAARYERISAEIVFSPDNGSIAPSRFRTDFIPDIGGMKTTVGASLLSAGNQQLAAINQALSVIRPRVSEEALAFEQRAESEGQADKDGNKASSTFVAFAQEGAMVEPVRDGWRVTVKGVPPGKVQRVEAEIPWPDGLEFGSDEFLSLEFRLGN